MDNAKIVLRLKKTIIYVDKILDNFPKKELVLKQGISNSLYECLEYSYDVYYSNDINIIRTILTKLKMIDFYLKISFDKNIISRKNISNLGIHLRDITNMYYGWLKNYEKSK